MCGIIGYLDYKNYSYKIEDSIFDKLIDSISHRGPDGRGKKVSEGIGFGHRRLSIIDLSENAVQPMVSSNEEYWITFNGEIYNFPVLKKELINKGYKFKSDSDTEVLLNSYIEWGIKCLDKISGIFAFAIWDSKSRRLFAARDQIGVKPFYYSDYNGVFFFSSEILPLMLNDDIPKELNYHGLDSYFSLGYIPAPDTGFRAIRQLEPAHYIIIENKKISINNYWDVEFNDVRKIKNTNTYISELDEILTAVVQKQTISDVPVGVFLSGGIDSFAIARALRNGSDTNHKAFSIGFDNINFDESKFSKLSASALDIELVFNSFLTTSDLFNKASYFMMDPFADSSSLAVYLLSQMTAKHVKVALGGDGADELFAGYSTYSIRKYLDLYSALPNFIKMGLIEPLKNLVPDIGNKYTYKEVFSRFLYAARKGKFHDHTNLRVIVPQELKKKIYSAEFYKMTKDYNPLEKYYNYIIDAKNRGFSDLKALLYSDLKFYLPGDMLLKVDRMSMANGLEVRVPFLDLDIVNYSYNLPDNMLLNNGKTKWILRKIIEDKFPKENQKMKKSGFNVPPHTLKYDKQYDNIGKLLNDNYLSCKSPINTKYSKFLLDYSYGNFVNVMKFISKNNLRFSKIGQMDARN